MPLPFPNLDTRRWTDLVAEGRALIPRYAPTWTDHNASDPGISIIELFAWLIEQDTYRVNRIPERHRRKFLSLIGFSPQPPKAAQTVLSFTLKADSSLTLPKGMLEAKDAHGRLLPFQTLSDLQIVPTTLQTILVDDGQGITNLTRFWREGGAFPVFGANAIAPVRPHIVQSGETLTSLARRYEATVEAISALNYLASATVPLRLGQRLTLPPSTALYLGFDRPLPVNLRVSLWFQIQGPGTDREARDRLLQEMSKQSGACRPQITCPPWESTDPWCQEATPSSQSSEGQTSKVDNLPLLHHSVRTVWEFYTDKNGGQWQALQPKEIQDNTRSLTLSGGVHVELPAAMKERQSLGNVTESRYYLRCRLETGQYDATPTCLGIFVNAVSVEQAKHVSEMLGTSTGLPLQQFPLPHILVKDGILKLLAPEGSSEKWEQREDLDASQRTDSHFMVNPTTWQVAFGDGERCRIPPANTPIQVCYFSTAGSLGNITAKASWQLIGDASTQNALQAITNPLPATDGFDAESLEHAAGRAAQVLWAHERLVELCTQFQCTTLDQIDRPTVLSRHAPDRATTLLDFERLALNVPGTQVARARAWSGIDANYPCLQAPGTVTVIIVPYLPQGHPQASPGLLQAVHHYLDRRRVIGTRLVVVGPTYLEVRVQATVRAKAGVRLERVQADIISTLNQFLDPLAGGPAQRGYPFGRDVYRSEILQMIDEVSGVDYVTALELIPGEGTAQCGNLCVPPNWLVTPGLHAIKVF